MKKKKESICLSVFVNSHNSTAPKSVQLFNYMNSSAVPKPYQEITKNQKKNVYEKMAKRNAAIFSRNLDHNYWVQFNFGPTAQL